MSDLQSGRLEEEFIDYLDEILMNDFFNGSVSPAERLKNKFPEAYGLIYKQFLNEVNRDLDLQDKHDN